MHRIVERMLKTHPAQSLAAQDLLAACIRACMTCAQACTACADACVAEHTAGELDRCIRLNQDCADVCAMTARVLSRQLAPDLGVVALTLELCAAACQSCAAECEHHADRYAHCHVCAAVCHECMDACRQLLPDTTDRARLHH